MHSGYQIGWSWQFSLGHLQGWMRTGPYWNKVLAVRSTLGSHTEPSLRCARLCFAQLCSVGPFLSQDTPAVLPPQDVCRGCFLSLKLVFHMDLFRHLIACLNLSTLGEFATSDILTINRLIYFILSTQADCMLPRGRNLVHSVP